MPLCSPFSILVDSFLPQLVSFGLSRILQVTYCFDYFVAYTMYALPELLL